MAAPASRGGPTAGPTEAELRELAMRADSARAQLGALEGQREYVGELLAEARRSLQSLESLARAKDGEELLIPLGAGAFVHGRLSQPQVALASLGNGVHAELPATDAAQRVRTRVESLEGAANALTQDIARLSEELARMNAVVESYLGGA